MRAEDISLCRLFLRSCERIVVGGEPRTWDDTTQLLVASHGSCYRTGSYDTEVLANQPPRSNRSGYRNLVNYQIIQLSQKLGCPL